MGATSTTCRGFAQKTLMKNSLEETADGNQVSLIRSFTCPGRLGLSLHSEDCLMVEAAKSDSQSCSANCGASPAKILLASFSPRGGARICTSTHVRTETAMNRYTIFVCMVQGSSKTL